MNTFQPFFIFSAERASFPADANAERSAALASQLKYRDIGAIAVDGCYKGATERAYLVMEFPDDTRLDAVLQLARRYGQESVLAVDANRGAELIYCADGRRESIGRFTAVSESEARAADAYTRLPAGSDGAAPQFFVCR